MQNNVRSQNEWKTIIALFLLGFSMWSSLFCVVPIEQFIRDRLSISNAQVSLLFTGPIIAMIIMMIPGGLFADKIGTRKAAGIGALLLMAGAILRGFSSNFGTIIIFSSLLGVGLGVTFPNLPKIAGTAVSREKAGIATGIYSAGIFIGVALSLALTPLLWRVTQTYQSIYFIWSIPPVIAAGFWWLFIKEPLKRPKTSEPAIGYIDSLKKVSKYKTLWLAGILLFLHNFFFYTWTGWAPILLRQKGATSEMAGLMTSVTQWAAILMLFILPHLYFRLGLRKPFLWGTSLVLAVCAGAAIYSGLVLDWVLMALVGLANSARFTGILSIPAETIPGEMVGSGGGLMLSLGYTGAIVGPLVGGYILDYTGNLNLSLIILIVLSLVAAGIAFMVPETIKKKLIVKG